MLSMKITSNPKIERISYIYERISRSNGVTISELAKELNVSTKTIQRDLHEVLSSAGVVCDGRTWKLDKSRATDDLKSDERIILGILDELAKGAGKQFYNKAHNLIEQISSQIDHPIHVNLDSEALSSENLELFNLLEVSIKKRVQISCNYRKGDFELKPIKLAFFDGFWYLLALDTKNCDKFKKFHLKSMKNVQMTDKVFVVQQELEQKILKANSVWFEPENKPFSARLFLEKGVVKYFERKPINTQDFSARYPDGSAEIVIQATHELEIAPIVMWYMPFIKVVEPQWLADAIKNKIEGYLKEIA